MKAVALGTSGTYPRYGRACSGFLIEEDPTFVLVDVGTGVCSNLFRHLDPFSLTAILITHIHADHVLDIYPMKYYLKYNDRGMEKRIPVYIPEGGEEILMSFKWGNEVGGYLKEVFDFHDIGGNLTIGRLRFSFKQTKHMIPTYALVCESDGKRVGYTSDTSWDDDLVEFFKGCEVLISEAAYQGEEGKENLHMTAIEAGRLASLTGVGRLYLTHIWPELDPNKSLEEAKKEFSGPVEILKEHLIIEV